MAEFTPARTFGATVRGVYVGPKNAVASYPVNSLDVTYEGIPGDRHFGLVRPSGPREPWYKRGTPMRNERQLSILSVEEMAQVAADLSIPELKPEWIGGNLLLSGVADLSLLPPRTLLMFPSGATIRIDGDNGPCRKAGRCIAGNILDRPDLEFAFVKAAKHRRGLIGWVEREGQIRVGDTVEFRIWEQAIPTR